MDFFLAILAIFLGALITPRSNAAGSARFFGPTREKVQIGLLTGIGFSSACIQSAGSKPGSPSRPDRRRVAVFQAARPSGRGGAGLSPPF